MMKEPKMLGIANRNLKNGSVTLGGIEYVLNSKNPVVIVENEDEAKPYVASRNYYLGNLPDVELVKWYRKQMPLLNNKIAELETKIAELEAKKQKKA